MLKGVCAAAFLFGAIAIAPIVAVADDLTIQYNRETGQFDSPLPHARAFAIMVPVDPSAKALTAQVWRRFDNGCKKGKDRARRFIGVASAVSEGKAFRVNISPLEFSSSYCFVFVAEHGWPMHLEDRIKNAFLAAIDRLSRHPRISSAHLSEALSEAEPLLTKLRFAHNGRTLSLPDHLARLGLGHPVLKQTIVAARRYGHGARKIHTAAHQVNTQRFSTLAKNQSDKIRTLEASIHLMLRLARDIPARLRSPSSGIVDDLTKLDKVIETVVSQVEGISCKAAIRAANCRGVQKLGANARELGTRARALLATAAAFQAHIKTTFEALDSEMPVLRKTILAPEVSRGTDIVQGDTKQGSIYLGADVGIVVPIFMDWGSDRRDLDIAVYAGVAVYAVPLDKDVPLSFHGGFKRRVSLNLGMSLTDVEDSDKTLSGIIAGKALMAGLGYRVTDHFRLGLGVAFVRQRDRNPAVSRRRVAASPYLSISVDIDMLGAMSKVLKRETPNLGGEIE